MTICNTRSNHFFQLIMSFYLYHHHHIYIIIIFEKYAHSGHSCTCTCSVSLHVLNFIYWNCLTRSDSFLRLDVKLVKNGPVGILDNFCMIFKWLWQNYDVEIQLWWTYWPVPCRLKWNKLFSTPNIHRYISFNTKIIFFLWKWSHWKF